MPIDLTNLNVQGSFDDVTLYGAHEAYVQAVKSDISKLRFDLKVAIPKLEAKGLYHLATKSGLLAFNAGGSFWATFSKFSRLFLNFQSLLIVQFNKIGGVTLIVKLYPRRVAKYKNDETYLELNKVNVDFAVKDMRFKIKEQISKPLGKSFIVLQQPAQLLINCLTFQPNRSRLRAGAKRPSTLIR
jgi:hypothetical protein